MPFPTIPTTAAGRLLTTTQPNNTATRTFPSLSSLTKDPNDLLIAIIAYYQSGVASNGITAWGGGFTEFLDLKESLGQGIAAAYKWSTGSETGTFAATQATAVTGHANMMLLSIPGAHLTTPPDGGGAASGSGTNADSGSFNPVNWDVEDTLWMTVCGIGETGTGGAFQGSIAGPGAPWTGYTETGTSGDAVGGMGMAISFLQSAVASVDPPAFNTDTSNARWYAVTMAVRPAAEVVADPSTWRTVPMMFPDRRILERRVW